MNNLNDKEHLQRLIDAQAIWIKQLQESQVALEKHRDGIVTLSESRLATIARGQSAVAQAVKNIAAVIQGNVSELNANAPAEIQEFLQALDKAGVDVQGSAALQSALLSAPDWRSEMVDQARHGRKDGIRLFYRTPDMQTCGIVLQLVDLIDARGFVPGERNAILANVSIAAS